MSEAFQIALIGVGGAVLGALLTAFVQPFWTILLGGRSTLQVEVLHSHFELPKFLKDAISEYVYNYKLNVRPNENVRTKLRSIPLKDGLSQLRITNKSKRSIEGIVVHLDNNDEFICDLTLDGETRLSEFTKSFTIGSLRPGAECKVIVWTSRDLTGRWSSATKAIRISAKEYDRISLAFPAPHYVSSDKLLISKKLFWIAFWILLVVVNVTSWGNLILHTSK